MAEKVDWVLTNMGCKDLRGIYSDRSWIVQRSPPSCLFFAPTSQVWGQRSIVWQSFNLALLCNTDSKWSQKRDVTTAACSNNKEVPFRMGRSEVRLKPEGNSEFREPQITHADYMAVMGTFLQRCKWWPGSRFKRISLQPQICSSNFIWPKYEVSTFYLKELMYNLTYKA